MWETQVTKYVLNYSHTTARRKSREYTRIRARALVCLSKALHTPSLSFSIQCMESAQYLSWCPLNCTSNVDYTNQPHVVLEFSCMSHIWTKFQHPCHFPISSHTWSNILPLSIKKYNYGIHFGQTSSNLIKFIVNSISDYVSKYLLYKYILQLI